MCYIKPMRDDQNKQRNELCDQCEQNKAEELHSCPYAEEFGDEITLCKCCDDCTTNCALDI